MPSGLNLSLSPDLLCNGFFDSSQEDLKGEVIAALEKAIAELGVTVLLTQQPSVCGITTLKVFYRVGGVGSLTEGGVIKRKNGHIEFKPLSGAHLTLKQAGNSVFVVSLGPSYQVRLSELHANEDLHDVLTRLLGGRVQVAEFS